MAAAHRRLLALAWVAAVCLGAGCSSSGSRPAAVTSAPATVTASPGSCPSPATSAAATFPPGPSSELPRPASATSPVVLPVQVAGVTLLRFTTPTSLRESALFVLKAYPAAGYLLRDGDSEGHEADIPFVKGALHGKTRLSGTAACTTTWLVSTVTPQPRPTTTP